VGIGSVAGIRGLPGHGAYCASKAAVIAYCESLRGEPVADLLPAGSSVRRAGTMAAAGMRALMLEAPPLETFDIKTLIDAGRD